MLLSILNYRVLRSIDLRRWKTGLEGWIFADYNQLAYSLGYAGDGAQPGNESWEPFENFTASFRILKSKIFGSVEVVELCELHAGARLNLGSGMKVKTTT